MCYSSRKYNRPGTSVLGPISDTVSERMNAPPFNYWQTRKSVELPVKMCDIWVFMLQTDGQVEADMDVAFPLGTSVQKLSVYMHNWV